ncbi:MAG: hypothetical protein ACOYXC_17885 [Candidatus Rifleibacteriota bacterium]
MKNQTPAGKKPFMAFSDKAVSRIDLKALKSKKKIKKAVVIKELLPASFKILVRQKRKSKVIDKLINMGISASEKYIRSMLNEYKKRIG